MQTSATKYKFVALCGQQQTESTATSFSCFIAGRQHSLL